MKTRYCIVVALLILSCSRESKSDLKSHATVNINIDTLESRDIAMGEPQSGDWLDAHFEPGQSFEQYTKAKPVSPTTRRNKIYLQPIGDFSKGQDSLLAFTEDYLEIFFGLETNTLPPLSESIIPDSARRQFEGGHEQLLTGFILDHLQSNIPTDGIVVMAITSKDLYPSANFNFVFGQASLKNRVGVSSFNRFTDGPLNSFNFSLCLNRLIKTSSHEIGHMFTCKHCTHAVCVMNGTNSLWESDSRPNRLCTDCLRKLHWNLGFDVKARAAKLKGYFAKHRLHEDFELVADDLKLLE